MAKKKTFTADEVCPMVGRSTDLIARGIVEGAYERIAAPRAAEATLKMLEDFARKHCPRKQRVW